LKITFLGTGTSQGVPLIACKCTVCLSNNSKDKRLRSSIHIQYGERSIIVDSGPDFRQQCLRANIERLDALLFTHGHKDHTAGFDDIRAFNYIQKEDINVYLDRRVEKILKKDFDYVFFGEKYPGVPEAKLHLFENKPFNIFEVPITPIEVLHYKLPVFGFRIDNFTYLTDVNHIPDSEMEKIVGTEYLVLTALRKEKHISHFTLDESLEIIERIKPKKAYLTHISHQLGLHEDVSTELPNNVKLAFDGLEVLCI
jgi:phosphoribosyl 1,2-cyclic phosphate phosphodiesterase